MGESEELFTTVNYIKHKVDAMEKIELLNLRSNKNLRDEYISILQSDDLLFGIYKEIDGIKAQKDIAVAVNTTDKSVSVKIAKLLELGLVEVKEVVSNKRIYKHTVAEQAFKLTKV
jgi:DNA-binding MarR family transcriptional regulator